MGAQDIVGALLVAGLVVFLVGAGAWRRDYERALSDSLPIIHADRRRRAWIHLWMIVAMFITPAGVIGYGAILTQGAVLALGLAAGVVYVLGALCWMVSLLFRLTVVPWAAERTADDGEVPDLFVPFDRWAASLYVTHMASAYAAFVLVGAAVLGDGSLPVWTGWLGVGWGAAFFAGFVVTRFAGPFNPPFWAHAYTGLVGVMLLVS